MRQIYQDETHPTIKLYEIADYYTSKAYYMAYIVQLNQLPRKKKKKIKKEPFYWTLKLHLVQKGKALPNRNNYNSDKSYNKAVIKMINKIKRRKLTL